MHAHCVSRPFLQMLDGFPNDDRSFHAHCVSDPLPVKSLRLRLAYRAHRHPQPYPIGPLLLSVGLMPALTRSPMPLALTLLLAADPLPIIRTRTRTKPTSTNPAGA